MFYYLFEYLEQKFDLTGAGVFKYISFRSGLAVITSLLIAMIFGKKIINMLRKLQVGETVRDLGLEGQKEKEGTPTMGGIIIIACILIPSLLFARIDNVYVFLAVMSTVWMGGIGFLDDYIKVFKKNKQGLAGKFKVVGQVGLGLIVGLTLFFNHAVVERHYYSETEVKGNVQELVAQGELIESELYDKDGNSMYYKDMKSNMTTIPFLKNNELDYGKMFSFLGQDFTWIGYVLIAIFIVTAVSNGANITDGIDGLAAGTTAIIALVLAVLAYVSGNALMSNYLNIMMLPNTGELVIFCSAFFGACVGFLWYNSFPAKVFMGDTGSLAIGGIVAVIALSLRKELMIPLICGIYLIENISVILQVWHFKRTKKKYGEGRRLFLMAPLHHHYQKKGMHEATIVIRFLIIGVILAIIALATLKLR